MKNEGLAVSLVLTTLILARGATVAVAQETRDPLRSQKDRGSIPAAPFPRPHAGAAVRTLTWAGAPAIPAVAGNAGWAGDWKEHAFHGHTRYAVTSRSGVPCLAAYAHGTGSLLYREIEPLPVGDLHLDWSWQVDTFPRGADLRSKQGDDRAAAVLVLYRKSILPWKMRAVIYVWSADLPEGTVLPSTYAKDIKVVVARSGAQAGWASENRDLAADYRRLFGGEPDPVKAVGVFTDSDNTGSTASALYGPLFFVREDRVALETAGGR